MIQKKKFSDAIAANISVVGGLLPISTVLSLSSIVNKTIAQVKQNILDLINPLNTQNVPVYISVPSGANYLMHNWSNDDFVIRSGAQGTIVVIGYYKTGGNFYASYEIHTYADTVIIRGVISNSQFS